MPELTDAPLLAGRVLTCSEYDPGGPPCGLIWYWMKGHQDKAEFAAAVDWDYAERYAADEVQHGYCRNVPTGYESDMTMHLVKDGTSRRGAYPITFIDVDEVGINRHWASRQAEVAAGEVF